MEITSCKLGLTDSQIREVFGSDKTIQTCETCNNLKYRDGMMTCERVQGCTSDKS